MNERLPAQLEAAALVRRAETQGGFGMILRKGDADRGSLVLLIAHRGEHQACLERALDMTGGYRWTIVGPKQGSAPAELADWSQKRARFDEDLWLIELDDPDPQRFIAETTSQG